MAIQEDLDYKIRCCIAIVILMLIYPLIKFKVICEITVNLVDHVLKIHVEV